MRTLIAAAVARLTRKHGAGDGVGDLSPSPTSDVGAGVRQGVRPRTTALASALLTVTALSHAPSAIAANESQNPDSTSASSSDDAEDKSVKLEEIVVIAQRRAQNINDVGITISAFDSQAIRDLGFQQPLDVATQTPNFSVNTLITGIPNFTIRGVGVNDYAINQATSVGAYVDQVYIVSPAMMLFQMFDTERVEVLKGPQGTLYGRNTTGGAVLFISKAPTQEFSASADLDIGNYGYYMVEGAVSGPLADNVFGRVAINSTQSDGYQESLVTGRHQGGLDRVSVRAILDWLPSDDVSLRLKAYSGQDKSGLVAFNTPGVGGNDTSTGTIDSIDGVPYRDNDSQGISLIADWDLGGITLTSVSSYDTLERFEHGDTDGLPIDGRIDQVLVSDIKQVSQELRIASSGEGSLTWVAGLYYGRDEIEDSTVYEVTGAGFPPIAFGLPSPYATIDTLGNTYDQISKAKAVFGQVEWDLSDWHFTAGVRYTEEDKALNDVSTPWTDEPGPSEAGPIASGLLFTPASYQEDFSAVSGKLGVDYRISSEALIYANVSKGFKSGGFQGTLVFSPANIVPFDEETVVAYEVGSKLTLAGGTVQLNTAAFYYDYEGLQAQGTIEGGAGGVENLFALQNIGDAEVVGLEVELTAAATDRLDFSLGAGYLDAKIVKPLIAEVQPDGVPAMSPKWTANGRARYAFVRTARAEWFVQTDFSYQDDVYFDIYETPFLREDGYWLWNASVGVASDDERWRASVWGRNLSDTEYRAGGFTGGVAGPVEFYGAPRTYGVSVSYAFD